ncbi:MAG TPA: hypothetical protein PLM56_17355 [Cyclobacteriaceae bacterium]|jgi:hypothetical protein|nr:hypothetical protein [Cyclobacteriaceae bacterium]HRF35276.1 hypothetical protein [Cyclobacteriaceae bacterium]
MMCPSGKRSYISEALATDALIEAHIQFEYRTGNGPVAFYKCEDCGAYHLTSNGVMNTRLAEALANGTIKRQKAAAGWNDKLKKRW